MNALPPDGSWADPLTKAERLELRRRLAKWCTRAWDAAMAMSGDHETRRPLVATSFELADLHCDVTERAKVATS